MSVQRMTSVLSFLLLSQYMPTVRSLSLPRLRPQRFFFAKITKEQLTKIAEQKMPDLNAGSLDAAISMIAGTARSMGITVVD